MKDVSQGLMNVLHAIFETKTNNLLKNIIESKNALYKSIDVSTIDGNIKDEGYTVLIFERAKLSSGCEENLAQLIKSLDSLISIIVITDVIDFSQKERLFDMGVTVVMNTHEFDTNKFSIYLDTVTRDLDTIRELKKMNIAVLDDSRFAHEIIKDFFKRINITHIDYFLSPSEMFDTNKSYDLFLIDLVMPELNGEEIIYSVRKKYPNSIILLITSYSKGRAIQHCLNVGANDFILKPFKFTLFMLRIYASINDFKAQQEAQKNMALLYELATKDPLTKVYNRYFFVDAIRRIKFESTRNDSNMSLILIDIDNFKQVNDEYGHQKGDLVLVETANVLLRELRKSDIVCRWGGEEFCILLPNTSYNDAINVAEKLRKAIEKMKIHTIRSLTASFGVSSWKDDDEEESIFRRLDNSLYLAKLTGKNKVICDGELLISKNENPIEIKWDAFFRSGNIKIDEEHHRLISLSNKIIESCFDDDAYNKTIKLFDELINDTIEHFKNEEKILDEVNYTNYKEHKEIHSELIEKTLLMQRGLLSKKFTPAQVATYVIQDVVIGHIIKSDFDYYDYFRN